MDSKQFDLMTSSLIKPASRRLAIIGMLGTTLGLTRWEEGDTKSRKHHNKGNNKGKGKNKNQNQAAAVQSEAAKTCTRPKADSCNCVYYVRNRTGLCGGAGTAAGYTERFMNGQNYVRVSPRAGAIMVWDANKKCATSAGHIAIVRSAAYNSRTRKWEIRVDHANWGGCGIRTNHLVTSSCSSANWGDLYGINFYVPR